MHEIALKGSKNSESSSIVNKLLEVFQWKKERSDSIVLDFEDQSVQYSLN